MSDTSSHPSPHRRKSKKGLPPGSHVYTGHHFSAEPDIQVYEYSPSHVVYTQPNADTISRPEEGTTLWININGISHTAVVQTVCNVFGIHYLFQEDILSVQQRPKAEVEDDYLFVTFRSLEWHKGLQHIQDEQISLVLAKNATLSFQERPGDHFTLLREKLKGEGSVLRQRGADYLFYRLLDITVDSYFDLLEDMGVRLEQLENEIMRKPTTKILNEIQANKKDLMVIRKNIYPMRDLLNRLINSDHPLISEQTVKYFRDVQDHTIQIIETVETFREINLSLKDSYLNAMSHEMNKIMKVLTIISTLFIPLTFIAGVYGMNFKYMPELEWTHGYFTTWGIMLSVFCALLWWFWRKGWF